jgi:hypothetical protein
MEEEHPVTGGSDEVKASDAASVPESRHAVQARRRAAHRRKTRRHLTVVLAVAVVGAGFAVTYALGVVPFHRAGVAPSATPHAVTAASGGSLTVNAASTTTAVVSNHNPAALGQAVTYTATVSVTAPGSWTPFASDTVTFKDGTTPITCGSGSQVYDGSSAATATCVVTYGALGSHAITAIFGGDPDDAPSTSPVLAQVVAPTAPGAPTTVTVVDNCVSALCSVTVSFTAPASTGGSPITSYTARCASSTGGATSTPDSGPGSPLTVPTTGADLTKNALYTCNVTATNAVGTGTPGTSASFIA